MKILDFAMEVDRVGRDFYRDLARRVESDQIRSFFEQLAEDEGRLMEDHLQLKMTGLEVDSELLKDEEEIFRRHRDRVPADGLEAYRLATAVEGEVCRLFSGAAERERDVIAREVLRQVAEIECGELKAIEAAYDFANAPNEYLAWGEFSNLDEFHNFGRYEDNRPCRHSVGNG